MNETVWGQVVDGVCVNVVVADAEWIDSQPGIWIMSTTENLAWKGATVIDGCFEPLPSPPPLPDHE